MQKRGNQRTQWAVFASLLLGGCSAVVDIEPDCDQVSECGAYLCNDENTACKAQCRSSSSDCATGFVCMDDEARCEGGLCVGRTPARSVSIRSQALRHYTWVPAIFENGRGVVAILGASQNEVSFARLDATTLAPVIGPGGVAGGAEVLDSGTNSRALPVILPPDRGGNIRSIWADAQGMGRIRSALYSMQSGALSPAETLYESEVSLASSTLAASSSGVDAHVVWIGGSARALYGLRITSLGAVSGPHVLSDDARAPALLSYQGTHRVFWAGTSPGGWTLFAREIADGADFYLAQAPASVWQGSGAVPSQIRVVGTDEGYLVFTTRTLGSGTLDNRIVRVVNGAVVGGAQEWLGGFRNVESVALTQHPQGGALALVAGRWEGERGLWLVQVLASGAVDSIPVRVLDAPLDARTEIETMRVAATATTAWVSWSTKAIGEQWGDFFLRGFDCAF